MRQKYREHITIKEKAKEKTHGGKLTRINPANAGKSGPIRKQKKRLFRKSRWGQTSQRRKKKYEEEIKGELIHQKQTFKSKKKLKAVNPEFFHAN